MLFSSSVFSLKEIWLCKETEKQADKLSLSAGFKMCPSFSLSRHWKLNAACQQLTFPHCFSSVVHQDVLPHLLSFAWICLISLFMSPLICLSPRTVMSAKAISEQTGKEFLYKYICTSAAVQNRFRYARVTAETDFDRLAKEHPWLLTEVRQGSAFSDAAACGQSSKNLDFSNWVKRWVHFPDL